MTPRAGVETVDKENIPVSNGNLANISTQPIAVCVLTQLAQFC
jgi:hypothetical protein